MGRRVSQVEVLEVGEMARPIIPILVAAGGERFGLPERWAVFVRRTRWPKRLPVWLLLNRQTAGMLAPGK
jgi:hypothetical protein